MKKSIIIVATICLMSGIAMAQTNQPLKKFSENIQIKSDSDKLLAVVDMDGKVTLASGANYDEVINILIVRMIRQNGQALEQIQGMTKLIDDARARANATTTKAAEIFQIWNPPAPKKEESKKVIELKPATTNTVTVAKEKSFWQKLTGK